jgi:hypothetical protein
MPRPHPSRRLIKLATSAMQKVLPRMNADDADEIRTML